VSESGSVSLDIASIDEEVKLLEGIHTTRGMRRLKADPVPVELIRKVCEAGSPGSLLLW
jgi:hypothetical protein